MDSCEKNFDFTNTDFVQIRQGILKNVEKYLPENIEIINIRHNQYHEVYSFKEQELCADISIFFKAKGTISDIRDSTKPALNELGSRILATLLQIKGGRIDVIKSMDLRELDKLSDKFTDFVEKIRDRLNQHDIKTDLIGISDYSFTLSFSKLLQNCTCVFHFNKFKQNLSVEAREKLKNQDLLAVINNEISEVFKAITNNTDQEVCDNSDDEDDDVAY